jgi:hypothetical protein
MPNFVVTLRREMEWQGVIEAPDPVEAIHAAHREARFEEVIEEQALVKELCTDENGWEVQVDVTPSFSQQLQ